MQRPDLGPFAREQRVTREAVREMWSAERFHERSPWWSLGAESLARTAGDIRDGGKEFGRLDRAWGYEPDKPERREV